MDDICIVSLIELYYFCSPMNVSSRLITLASFLLLLLLNSSCKTKFEKIRISNDPERVLREAHAYFDAEDFYKAQTLYELAIPAFRGKLEAEKIFFNYAYTHYNTKQYMLSSHYFKNFANTFGNSEKKEEADYMAAYSHYAMSPAHNLDQSESDKAIEAFQLFMNTYPDSERVKECNELITQMRAKMEDKAFEEGKLYFDLKRYNSATTSLANMLKDFPETDKAAEVRYLIAKASFLLADNSVYLKKVERYNEAIARCNDFLKKHSKTKFKKEVDSYLEDSQKELNRITDGRS